MSDLPVELSGSTLIVGPSGAGKTRLTARALAAWVDSEGTDDVVVFEFAPEVERDGRILGGRLDRFLDIPEDVWLGILDAHAPRSDGEDEAQTREYARENAQRATRIFEAAPAAPRAVFVNDATIPFQHSSADPAWLLEYCDGTACAVANAFESEELGVDDPVSRRERAVLATLKQGTDRLLDLS